MKITKVVQQIGRKHSKRLGEIRKAIDELLIWLRETLPEDFVLPCNCCWNHSGEFVRKGLTNPPSLGTTCVWWKITIGNKHSLSDLHYFAHLLSEGFLEELSKRLEDNSAMFAKDKKRINLFLMSSCSTKKGGSHDLV